MRRFHRSLCGEFKKRKRSLYLLLHLGIPLVLPAILIVYFLSRKVPINPEASYIIFFELIGVGTPVMISIICGIVADTESEAGHFQNMLGVFHGRITTFLSQTTMMILSYMVAMLFIITIYTLSLKYLVGVPDVYFTLSYLTGIIFAITAIFQYFFYQFIGYKYGMGICSMFGFGGMIIAALCLTTLGDEVWFILPWAWLNRFSEYLWGYWNLMDTKKVHPSMLLTEGVSFLILTSGMILLSIVWFSKWEGRKTNE